MGFMNKTLKIGLAACVLYAGIGLYEVCNRTYERYKGQEPAAIAQDILQNTGRYIKLGGECLEKIELSKKQTEQQGELEEKVE